MNCPNCKDVQLTSVMTKNGVLVDLCPRCEGIWLDRGEIFYFTKAPTYVRWKIEEALKTSKPSTRLNPHTHTPLVELTISEDLKIDYCPKSGGIWLDKGELERIPTAKKVALKIDIDRNTHPQTLSSSQKISSVVLPNLGLTSFITLFTLYAFLTLVLIILVNFNLLTPFIALVIGVVLALIQFIFSPFIMDISLRWFYRVRWVNCNELSEHLKNFLRNICGRHNIKLPRIGIIPDGSPNAFTYGHTPNNARIVITSGIIDLLEPHELEAVIAHEVGHVVHWDMLIMTIAYTVPLILYYIYRTLIRMRTGKEDKAAPYRYAIAIGSYILYIISEYIVLWFSRIREYFADRFSGNNTDPGNLSSALVKIGYGLAGREKKKEERKPQLEGIKALGIFDPASAKGLAIASYHPQSLGGEIEKENLKEAMKWDLWNPWALYYEVHSTHPLIAKRLNALSLQCQAMGRQPYIVFDLRKPESYWDEFFYDLLISFLPLLTIILSVATYVTTQNTFYLKFGLFLLGASKLFKAQFSYKSSYFAEMNISSLLKKVKVSSIRPVPCILEGKIIGRGVPGLIWSEDFVLQDKTGIVFLDYRQPLAIWNFLFGVLRAKHYIGEEVKITGWYRRSPVPYVEIKTLETASGRTSCYVFNIKIIFSVILMILGIILILL